MRSPPGYSATTSGLCSERGVAADLGLAGRRYYAVEIFPHNHNRNPAHESSIRFQVDCAMGPVTEDTH